MISRASSPRPPIHLHPHLASPVPRTYLTRLVPLPARPPTSLPSLACTTDRQPPRLVYILASLIHTLQIRPLVFSRTRLSTRLLCFPLACAGSPLPLVFDPDRVLVLARRGISPPKLSGRADISEGGFGGIRRACHDILLLKWARTTSRLLRLQTSPCQLKIISLRWERWAWRLKIVPMLWFYDGYMSRLPVILPPREEDSQFVAALR
ncbi:hypothetical protein FA13DRAFT_1745921 [Coprinellus micaceus]|uniref:Uncharacterized protein n=1 Tax=Coprinellus micaceus TaxID=71717 RepID=A0A4Y7SA03_COPMI|nr:hypothetical protein FA13DRAFT_1745921 [Coprinellus micaceus]